MPSTSLKRLRVRLDRWHKEDHLFDDRAGPIARVREGMTVRDADGNKLGTVDYVQLAGGEQGSAYHRTMTL